MELSGGNSKAKILLIDDDLIFHFLLRDQVQALSTPAELISKENGVEAIKYLNNLKKKEGEEAFPDVILVDLRMPLMDGWEFLETFEANFNLKKVKSRVFITPAIMTDRLYADTKSFKIPLDFVEKPFPENYLKDLFEESTSPVMNVV